jgi:hypothetical protein
MYWETTMFNVSFRSTVDTLAGLRFLSRSDEAPVAAGLAALVVADHLGLSGDLESAVVCLAALVLVRSTTRFLARCDISIGFRRRA